MSGSTPWPPGKRLAGIAVICGAALLLLLGAAPALAVSERSSRGGEVIEGRYIVVYEDSVRSAAAKTDWRERRLGFEADLEYGHVVRGFAAELSPAQVERLRRDQKVDYISRDRRVRALAEVPLAEGETVPTGVRRIRSVTGTTTREHSEAGVAVIDTGIDLDHPDLSSSDGTNCISSGEPADDDNGHGTHVAGTVAARNNGLGVVGMAPGTEVHAVKVLDENGEGSTSTVVCGIDWITANHASLGIEVANMSLGGPGMPVASCDTTTDPMHEAICDSTAAGVNYVVAAGNDEWDFDFESEPDTPAAYPEVLTVTAVSDSDGQPGGHGGSPDCRPDETDDAAASFSNFALTVEGEAHTIAAPGVCIVSTWLGDPGGSYRMASGTSMASPHIAGAVALCIDEAGDAGPCAGRTPAEVIDYMGADAADYNAANSAYGFTGDPDSPFFDRYYGFMARAIPPPPVNTSPPSVSGTTQEGATIEVSTGEWSGEPSFSYQWHRCNGDGTSCTDITGAIASTYELTGADIDHRLRATVIAENASGTASATSEPTELVIPLPPANRFPPAISGIARDGETLETSDGVWTGEGPITFTYEWHRCNGDGTSCTDITGAIASTYELTGADIDHRLRATVVAENAGGAASATSALSAVIDPAAESPPSDADPEPVESDPETVESEDDPDAAAFWECARHAVRVYLASTERAVTVIKRSRVLAKRARQAADVRQPRRAIRRSRRLRIRGQQLRRIALLQGRRHIGECRSQFL